MGGSISQDIAKGVLKEEYVNNPSCRTFAGYEGATLVSDAFDSNAEGIFQVGSDYYLARCVDKNDSARSYLTSRAGVALFILVVSFALVRFALYKQGGNSKKEEPPTEYPNILAVVSALFCVSIIDFIVFGFIWRWYNQSVVMTASAFFAGRFMGMCL